METMRDKAGGDWTNEKEKDYGKN